MIAENFIREKQQCVGDQSVDMFLGSVNTAFLLLQFILTKMDYNFIGKFPVAGDQHFKCPYINKTGPGLKQRCRRVLVDFIPQGCRDSQKSRGFDYIQDLIFVFPFNGSLYQPFLQVNNIG